MKFGAHVSIAEGIWNAPGNAADLGCETFQIFTRPPQGGPAKAIDKEAKDKFWAEMDKYGLEKFVVHAPYYINFGSAEARIYKSAIRIIREELDRSNSLKAEFMMFHPGSAKETGQEQGMKQVTEGVGEALKGYRGDTQLLIEISAGAGMVLGDTFDELAEMLEGLKKYLGKTLGGICFDTQHAFGAGYDLRTEEGWRNVLEDFNRKIGLEYLKMSHVNDSKISLGEHKDRHEHIGKGKMGKKSFKAMLNMPVWKNKLLILETEHDLIKEDLKILKNFRSKKDEN